MITLYGPIIGFPSQLQNHLKTTRKHSIQFRRYLECREYRCFNLTEIASKFVYERSKSLMAKEFCYFIYNIIVEQSIVFMKKMYSFM